MPFDVKQYMTELAKSAGVEDAKLQAALEVLGNEKISKAFGDGFLRQEDYSRNMDGLTKKQKELNEWYEKQVQVAASNQKTVDDYNAKLKQYEETYGTLDGTGTKPSVDTSQFIDKKVFDEAMAQKDSQFLGLLETGLQCASDYMYRFKEPLNIGELKKFALESGLPLNAAYEKFIAPKVQEIEHKTWEQKIADAAEAARQDERSKRANPTDPGTVAPNGFMANAMKSAGTGSTLSEGFVDAWNKHASKQ